VIYLDSAAIVKLVRAEAASTELVHWLDSRVDMPLVSSALSEVEVPRALRRTAPASLAMVASTMARIYRLEIDVTVRAAAAALHDPRLRILDAIHLATALNAGEDIDAFVSYDVRLLGAAERAGLPIASPGAE
jgi:predicted nucleic acid-binding protein